MTSYELWVEERIDYFTKFEHALFFAFYVSDGENKTKLRKAFPEYFIQDAIDKIEIPAPVEPRKTF